MKKFYLITSILVLIFITTGNATNHYVKADATGADNGTSWGDAYTDLQSALSAAGSSDSIFVAAGTYVPGSGDRFAAFYLKNGVKLIGGFAGDEAIINQAVLDSLDYVTNETILSGDQYGDDIGFINNEENSYHVVYANAEISGSFSSATEINGFTIKGGNADDTNPNDVYNKGGGLYGSAAVSATWSVTIKNMNFTYNYATNGGALYITSKNSAGTAYPAISNCVFDNNVAGYAGGAVYNYAAIGPNTTTFNNCEFLNNSSSGWDGGGAIYNYAFASNPGEGMNNPYFKDVLFYNNSSNYHGSAISNSAGQSAYAGNPGYGGTINTTIINATFVENNTSTAIDNRGEGFGETYLDFTNVILWNTSVDEVVHDSIADATFEYCLVELSGGSSSWDSGLGTDIGNNYDADPELVNMAAGDVTLYLTSPAMFSGDGINGDNIGYYQGAGIDNTHGIFITGGLVDFGTLNIYTYSTQQSYQVEALDMTDDLIITAPDGFQISTSSNDFSGNTDTIILAQSGGEVALTTIYVRFAPTVDGPYSGNILHQSIGLDDVNIAVSGTGAIPFEIFVSTSATGLNDGSSWANAFTDLQDALLFASYGDVIYVATGTYTPAAADRYSSFVLVPGVGLYGGFEGTEYPIDQTVLNSRDFTLNETILSGDQLENDNGFSNNDDNSYHVIEADATASGSYNSNTILDGFTVSGGNADGISDDKRGGGLFLSASAFDEVSPTIANIKFTYNSAESGGGMYSEVTSTGGQIMPMMSNIEFISNRVVGSSVTSGGAMYNYAGIGICSPIIDQVIFSGNTATSGSAYGGAIYNWASSGGICNPQFKNAFFKNNNSNYLGSAIYNRGGSYDAATCSPVIINATFINHTQVAVYNQQQGGTCNPELINVILYNDYGEEMYNAAAASPQISYSLIQGSGGSSSWNGSFGIDNGNNVDDDPDFVNMWEDDVTLYTSSPAMNTGNPAYGNNIGYYQGAGVDNSSGIFITGTLTDFGTVNTGSASLEQSYKVQAFGMTDDLIITAPAGFQLSLYSNDYSGNTDVLTIPQWAGETALTTIYVRFAPMIGGFISDSIAHQCTGMPDVYLPVTGTGVLIFAISVIDNVTICGDEDIPQITTIISDPQGGAINFTFSSTDEYVVPVNAISIDSVGSYYEIQIDTSQVNEGMSLITVNAFNNIGDSVTTSFYFNMSEIPVITDIEYSHSSGDTYYVAVYPNSYWQYSYYFDGMYSYYNNTYLDVGDHFIQMENNGCFSDTSYITLVPYVDNVPIQINYSGETSFEICYASDIQDVTFTIQDDSLQNVTITLAEDYNNDVDVDDLILTQLNDSTFSLHINTTPDVVDYIEVEITITNNFGESSQLLLSYMIGQPRIDSLYSTYDQYQGYCINILMSNIFGYDQLEVSFDGGLTYDDYYNTQWCNVSAGTYTVLLRQNGCVSEPHIIEIGATDPLIISYTGDNYLTYCVGETIDPIDFTISDDNLSDVNLTILSYDQYMLPDSNMTLTDNGGGSYTLEINPATGLSGSFTIAISASNTNSENAYLSININISEIPVLDSVLTYSSFAETCFEIYYSNLSNPYNLYVSIDGGQTFPYYYYNEICVGNPGTYDIVLNNNGCISNSIPVFIDGPVIINYDGPVNYYNCLGDTIMPVSFTVQTDNPGDITVTSNSQDEYIIPDSDINIVQINDTTYSVQINTPNDGTGMVNVRITARNSNMDEDVLDLYYYIIGEPEINYVNTYFDSTLMTNCIYVSVYNYNNYDSLTISLDNGVTFYPFNYEICGMADGLYTIIVKESACSSESYTIEVSVPEIEGNELDFAIYPNPNDGRFTIDITSSEYSDFDLLIYNSIGQQVSNKHISAEGNFGIRESIDFSTQPKGIYYVYLKNDRYVGVKKVVVQ